jgi:hypothetical protein
MSWRVFNERGALQCYTLQDDRPRKTIEATPHTSFDFDCSRLGFRVFAPSIFGRHAHPTFQPLELVRRESTLAVIGSHSYSFWQ